MSLVCASPNEGDLPEHPGEARRIDLRDSLAARSAGEIDLHLPTDSPGDLGWFPSTSFVTVDDSTPSSWVTQIDEDGNLSVGPRSWLSPGFWERFYDGDGVAAEIVRHELEALTGGVSLWARKSWLDR